MRQSSDVYGLPTRNAADFGAEGKPNTQNHPTVNGLRIQLEEVAWGVRPRLHPGAVRSCLSLLCIGCAFIAGSANEPAHAGCL